MGDTKPMPAREFVENGLLHAVNFDWFWPYGMTLTATAWTEDERIRAELVPSIRQALLESFDEVVTWVNGRDGMLPTAEDDARDERLNALIDALWPRLAAAAGGGGLVGKVAEGFTVVLTDPPDDIVTALSPAEAAERKRKAQEWRSRRLTAITDTQEAKG